MSWLTIHKPSIPASHTPAAGPMTPAFSKDVVAGGCSGLGAVGVPVCTAQAAGSPGRAPPHWQSPAAADGLPHGALACGSCHACSRQRSEDSRVKAAAQDGWRGCVGSTGHQRACRLFSRPLLHGPGWGCWQQGLKACQKAGLPPIPGQHRIQSAPNPVEAAWRRRRGEPPIIWVLSTFGMRISEQNCSRFVHTYLSGVDRCSRRARAYSHCLPCTLQAVASTRVPSVLLDGIIYDRPLRRLRPSAPMAHVDP